MVSQWDKAFLHHVHIAVANHKGPKNVLRMLEHLCG